MKKENLCIGEDDLKYLYECKTIIGVDDCGRGPIAGGMFIGFVSFKYDFDPSHLGLNDSKKLKDKTHLFDDIIKNNSDFHVEEISVEEINSGENLNNLFGKGFKRGLEKFNKQNSIIFLDGEIPSNCVGYPIDIINKSNYDGTSWHVAAASIIAKNAQINSMLDLDIKYPNYGFKDHHGYGTKKHFEALVKYGICSNHRFRWIDLEKIKGKLNVSK